MGPAFEKLTKILALEKEQGYQNRAVIGGLGKLAPFWRREASSEDPKLVEEVAALLQSYPTLGRQEREGVVGEILAKLKGKETEEAKPPQPEPRRIGLDSPVTRLAGIGPKYAKHLKRVGVNTIRDMLYLFPRRYNDFTSMRTISQLRYGEEVTVMGTIWDTQVRQARTGRDIVTCVVGDGTATIKATWFNQSYLAKKLRPGRQMALSGKVDEYLGYLTFKSPEWELLGKDLIHTGGIVPVYPLTEGLSARWMRRRVKRTVDYWGKRLPDHLPHSVRERAKLMDLETAISQIHFPDDGENLRRARRRLCFDEFFLIQMGVLRQRHIWRSQQGKPVEMVGGGLASPLLRSCVDALPFELTSAQKRVLDEIIEDLQKDRPMSRLLQGDVGSGKTAVAAIAMLITALSGYQAAMMAPTEILAEQHYKTITELFENAPLAARSSPLVTRLLIGSLKPAEKERIRQEIATGKVDIVIGTHALIQEGVEFKDLGLAVIDEQHRFGVLQRASMRQKGVMETRKEAETRKHGEEFRDLRPSAFCPHVLVMSATPIPRTLALTIYGDLDVSVIDELPPGRWEIKTKWLLPSERERAYSFLRSQVEKGHQAFVICPLVEESEKIEAKAAVEEYERLQEEVFPDLRLGLLHGRMKAEEKDEVMAAFKRGELDMLVSTPVVEVGIDVPNATVMLIDGADRFGLAQLHQFRGRVGRGEHQSYCLLLAESPSVEGEERLKAIESTQDGFVLAEKDLEMRGPGEFFGTRQSGLPDLKLAKLSDVSILEQARAEAQALFQEDPDLSKPEHKLLARKVEEFWRGEGDLS
ncbi:MAG: ATP-dependent DNA helicase RecG [Chloroflexota bacterium]|nr:ATP-dependent DNA helicase RecG [Chloroflexota bacterium]